MYSVIRAVTADGNVGQRVSEAGRILLVRTIIPGADTDGLQSDRKG